MGNKETPSNPTPSLALLKSSSFPADLRSFFDSAEPLLDSDEESRRIKSWLKEDEKIEFDFNEESMSKREAKKTRPKSGRVTADDLDERPVLCDDNYNDRYWFNSKVDP